jgi:hypothetical protein
MRDKYNKYDIKKKVLMPPMPPGEKQFFLALLSRDNQFCLRNTLRDILKIIFSLFHQQKSFSACSKSFLHFPSLRNVNNLIFFLGFGLLGEMALR